jgi:hypothetical protein
MRRRGDDDDWLLETVAGAWMVQEAEQDRIYAVSACCDHDRSREKHLRYEDRTAVRKHDGCDSHVLRRSAIHL